MKKPPIYLVFSKGDIPRIHRSMNSIPEGARVLVNPDLKLVRGVPMHQWELEMFEPDVPQDWDSWQQALIVASAVISVTFMLVAGLSWML